jgi:phospholipid/cholesterol/gamma-HCH transport system substrate-binding protein
MSPRFGRATAAAALLCAAVALAVILIGGGGGRYTVTAEFSDVRGLVQGAQVRLAGVTVGSVGRIWLGPDGWPRAQLSIDDDVSMRAGGTAAVRLASLSGEFNRYVSVVQGSGPRLGSGALIPRARTTSPVEVDDALSTFDPATRRALTETLTGMRTTLTGEGPALQETLRSTAAALGEVTRLSDQLDRDGSSLQTLLRSGHTLASTLAQRTPQLEHAVDQTAALLHTVAGRAGEIATSVAALPQGLDAAHAALASVKTFIAPTTRLLTEIGPAVDELPATAAELRNALVSASPALGRAATLAQLAPPAAQQFEPVLHAAGPLLPLMTPVLTRLGPMLDQLRVRLPDAFSFFANWADFTSNYDANGHAARVGIVLPPAPTTVLPPSSDGPGQLLPPYLRTPGSLEGQPWTDYYKSFVAGGQPGPDVAKAGR